MSRALVVYIAGPLSHPDIEEQARNVERAMRAAWHVAQKGHIPLCPHLTHYLNMFWTAFMGDSVPYETWMAWALELVRRSDGLLFLGSSPGADREMSEAICWGLPVWTRLADVPAVEGR